MKQQNLLPTPWENYPRLPRGQQAILFTVLVETYARLVAADYSRFWLIAENAVFNDWTLLYCNDVLRYRKLKDLISRGCQLEYVSEWAPNKIQEAAVEVAEDAVAVRQWLIKQGAARKQSG